MKIRQAQLQDVPALAQMNQTVQQWHHDAQPSRYKPPMDSADLQQWFIERLQDESWFGFIAEVDGKPAGYVLCRVDITGDNPYVYPSKTLHINQISVDASFRRQGIGRALVQAARETAQTQGVSALTLGVHAQNARAQAFFQTMGFVMAHHSMRIDL